MNAEIPMAVAVLGASAKPDRYSYQAVAMLKDKGYRVYPVHPVLHEILGLSVAKSLSDIPASLDTVTVYLSPERSTPLGQTFIKVKPRRVIFNPGAENPELARDLKTAGIEVIHARTLVMLKTGQFAGPKKNQPLRSCSACIPCLLRQAREAIGMTGTAPEKAGALLEEIAAMVSAESMGVHPPLVSQKIQRLIRERTQCADPYRQMKADLNQAALGLLPAMLKRIPSSMSEQEAAVRLAIAGNILDAGAKSRMELTDAIAALEGAFQQPLQGDWGELFTRASKAERILYLADNAGEIVFDRHLVNQLPPGRVAVAVRGKAVINDALMEDALAVGMDEVARVMPNGSDAPGTILSDCSAEFCEAFAVSDLIIAKGQGNYETLCASEKPVVFLFQAKCPVVAEQIGAAVGTLVVESGYAREWAQ